MKILDDVLPLVGVIIGGFTTYWVTARQSAMDDRRSTARDRLDTCERFAQAAKATQRTLYRVAAAQGLDANHETLQLDDALSELERYYIERDIAFESIRLRSDDDVVRAAQAWARGLAHMREALASPHRDGSGWSAAVADAQRGRTLFYQHARNDRS